MTDHYLDELGPRALREFMGLMLGERLGGGMSREVYAHAHDPSKVIKIEIRGGFFQNIIEWQTWDALKWQPKAKPWLAPCHWISSSGIYLIMERTMPLRKGEEPKLLPSWLTDHKSANYGLIGKKVVCHDYGTNVLLEHTACNVRMRKTHFE